MSMALEEAIRYYEESEKINKELAEICVSAMSKNHNLENAEKCRQMIDWLRELQERRKADSCEGCINESGKSHLLVCCTCRRHYHYADLYKPERRTDGSD